MTQEVGFIEPRKGKLKYEDYPIGKLLLLIPYHVSEFNITNFHQRFTMLLAHLIQIIDASLNSSALPQILGSSSVSRLLSCSSAPPQSLSSSPVPQLLLCSSTSSSVPLLLPSSSAPPQFHDSSPVPRLVPSFSAPPQFLDSSPVPWLLRQYHSPSAHQHWL